MIVTIPSMTPLPDRVRQHSPQVYGNEVVTWRSTYTEKAEGVPQMLLVEQPEPGSELLPHYHASDQFQVFIDGDGLLGKHALAAISVHYTNRYTGYGPIVAGPQGVSYYVLRPAPDPLGPGQYLFRPELREKIKTHPGPKRTFVADGIRPRPEAELRILSGVERERLFSSPDDAPDAGTLAELVSIGPGQSFTVPEPALGGGQVLLVLAGSLIGADGALGPRAAVAVTRDDSAITLPAGPGGAQVLLMQYPRWS
jgi:hypothetical protein